MQYYINRMFRLYLKNNFICKVFKNHIYKQEFSLFQPIFPHLWIKGSSWFLTGSIVPVPAGGGGGRGGREGGNAGGADGGPSAWYFWIVTESLVAKSNINPDNKIAGMV